MDRRRAVGRRPLEPWVEAWVEEGRRWSPVALAAVVAVGLWPAWALRALVLIAAGATLGLVVAAANSPWSVRTCMRRGALAGTWGFGMLAVAIVRGLADPAPVIEWAAAPPIGALVGILSTLPIASTRRRRDAMSHRLARRAAAGAVLALAVRGTSVLPAVQLCLLAALAGLAASLPVALWVHARRAAGRPPRGRWADPARILVLGPVLGLSAALQWTLGDPVEAALRLWPVALGSALAAWPLLGALRSLPARRGGWRLAAAHIDESSWRRSLVGLTAGVGAGALLVPGGWLAGALLVAGALIEAVRLRFQAIDDEGAARSLESKVPRLGGIVAGGVSYGFIFLTLLTPRAFAEQVGLSPDDWRVRAIPGIAIASFSLYLIASPALQRWLPGGSRGSRVLGSVLLGSGGAGAIAMALAPTWPLLYVGIVLAAAGGAGGVLLKCQIAAAAGARGQMNRAVSRMLVSNVVTVCAFPFGAAVLIELAPGGIGGVRAHALAFVVLGALLFAALRLVPPLLRGGATAVREPEQGLGGRRLWRAISLTGATMGALGPIDAGLVFLIAYHLGDQGAELWTGLALLSSLPAAILAHYMERVMKRRTRLVAIFGSAMALAGAGIGFAVQGWVGLGWGIAFGIAYWLIEPATTIHWLMTEWIAIRNPAHYSRVALVTGARQFTKAIAAFAFLAGESTAWLVAMVIAIVAMGIAIPAWGPAPSRPPGRERRSRASAPAAMLAREPAARRSALR